jgi:hypothetical protein
MLQSNSDVGAGIDAEGLVNLALAIDGELIEGASAAGDEGVVDQAQVVNEVTLALVLALGGATTGLTAGGAIRELLVNSVNSFLSNSVVVASELFSCFQACSSTLDGTLDSFQIGAGRET